MTDLRSSEIHDELEGDTLHEECGVFGILGHPDAATLTALGLHALQHRGQEAAGIVTTDGKQFYTEKRMGLVGDHYTDPATLAKLPGYISIGHTRYSTTGEVALRNVQPLFAELEVGGIAVAHNGNFTNGLTLRRQLIADGAICQSTSDTEVVLHLIARSKQASSSDRFIDAIRQMEGGYSMLAMTRTKLIAARDPIGIRPLVMGELDGKPIFCSETCALDIIGAKYIRDIENGEVVICEIQPDGSISVDARKPQSAQPERPCLFEYVYFARPDSVVAGRSVYVARRTWASISPKNHRSMRTSSFLYPMVARRLRSATHSAAASPSNTGSSAITMSVEPSSSRLSRSAPSASSSSIPRTGR